PEARGVEDDGSQEDPGTARDRQGGEGSRRQPEPADGDGDASEPVREPTGVVADGGHDEREDEEEEPGIHVLIPGVDRQERHEGTVAQHHQEEDRGGHEGLDTHHSPRREGDLFAAPRRLRQAPSPEHRDGGDASGEPETGAAAQPAKGRISIDAKAKAPSTPPIARSPTPTARA